MKQRYIKFIIIMLCCLAGFLIQGKKAYAVDPDVYGYVLTAGTNAPVSGVWVKWVNSANGITPGGGAYQYAQTDATGKFYFHSYDSYTNAQMTTLETTEISTHNNGIDDDTQVSSGAAQTTFGCAGNPNTFSVITPASDSGTFNVQGSPSQTLIATINNDAAPLNVVTFTYQPSGLTVSGTVYVDTNRNGIQDAGESGYQGAMVTAGTISVDTDANGNYSIPNVPNGLETISITLPAMYKNTTPATQTINLIQNQTVNFGIVPTYTISGNIFLDSNRNGIKDIGEGNYQGATIKLSGDANTTTTSDANGNYTFSGLYAGSYTVSMNSPPGYTSTTPTTEAITLNSNQSVNFGIAQLYAISGYSFDDSNRNGILDSGEQIYPGITVTLSGLSSQSVKTDGNGNYSFTNLQPGVYTVTFTNPAKHTNTTPLTQTFTLTSNYTVNFGTVGIYTISGEVFIDKNGQGKLNGSDTPYQGATVNLLDSVGNPFETTTSDANGNYSFPNTYEGSYKLSVTIPSGYGATTPDLLDLNIAGDQTVNFGIQPLDITKIAGQCTGSTADIVIVFDHSGSMNDADLATGNPKIDEAKKATNEFINIIIQNVPSARIGIIQFSGSTNYPNDPSQTGVLVPLTTDTTTLTNAVNNITANDNTCHECGIQLANQMLQANSRPNSQKIVVLVTDGIANETVTSNDAGVDTPDAENAAMTQIIDGVDNQNIVYNTIGLGQNGSNSAVNIDVAFLQEIAASNGGLFFDDPDQGTMETIFQNLAANSVGSGIISGFVFNDKNNNGTYDASDAALPNFTVMLSSPRLASSVTTTTDANGDYQFVGLCNATFTISEPSQPPWVPTTPISQSLDVISGDTYPNVDFGDRFGYSINGDLFIDTNKNGSQDPGEQNYTGGSTITSSGGTITNNSDGSYSITGLLPGTYQVSYVSPIPNNFVLVNPIDGFPPSYDVTVGPACNTNNAPGATCSTDNITNLSFGITDFFPWVQSSCNDVREDYGISNHEPLGQYLINTNASCTNPGTAFTGNVDSYFGLGSASSTEQIAGGSQYPELYDNSGSSTLQTSYSELLAKAQNAGITPTDLSTVCDITNCQLPATLSHGIYIANGDVTLQGFNFPANQNYVILINGNLNITGNISIPVGSSAIFSTMGNITVSPTVGSAPNDPTSSLDGWYVAGESFFVNSAGVCNDIRLNIAGSVVVNALGNGGTFQNNRDLCGNDMADPTVTFLQRLDMLLNAPQFIQSQQTISQEIVP